MRRDDCLLHKYISGFNTVYFLYIILKTMFVRNVIDLLLHQ